jgi:predicted DNA-binding transcriptional regulator YafY
VLKAGTWYLVAQSGSSIRTYRMANIQDAEITEETFERPKRFDLATHWNKACGDYEAGLWRGQAQVRLSPRGVALLELLGSQVQDAARQTKAADRDGWIRCTLPIESEAQGVRELIRLCEDVEVLGPPALRKKMGETLALMASRHDGGEPRPTNP